MLEQAVLDVMRETVDLMDRSGIPYMIGGGFAAMAYGLRSATHDVDVFVEPRNATETLKVFQAVGYRVWIEDPIWIYKAVKKGVEVDIIYESAGIVHFGALNFSRARRMPLQGVELPIMSPEDLLVTKALAANPETPRHLADLVSLLKRFAIDWEYVMTWSAHGPRRFLAALVAAQDAGATVPAWVLAELAKQVPGLLRVSK